MLSSASCLLPRAFGISYRFSARSQHYLPPHRISLVLPAGRYRISAAFSRELNSAAIFTARMPSSRQPRFLFSEFCGQHGTASLVWYRDDYSLRYFRSVCFGSQRATLIAEIFIIAGLNRSIIIGWFHGFSPIALSLQHATPMAHRIELYLAIGQRLHRAIAYLALYRRARFRPPRYQFRLWLPPFHAARFRSKQTERPRNDGAFAPISLSRHLCELLSTPVVPCYGIQPPRRFIVSSSAIFSERRQRARALASFQMAVQRLVYFNVIAPFQSLPDDTNTTTLAPPAEDWLIHPPAGRALALASSGFYEALRSKDRGILALCFMMAALRRFISPSRLFPLLPYARYHSRLLRAPASGDD